MDLSGFELVVLFMLLVVITQLGIVHEKLSRLVR